MFIMVYKMSIAVWVWLGRFGFWRTRIRNSEWVYYISVKIQIYDYAD